METTLQDLKTRRSIRKFKPQQIRDAELEKILEAGTYAPTGMDRQSPKIVVIQNAETIRSLSKMNANVFSPPSENDPFYGAPTVLVVLADRSASTHIEDASLVMGNLMNAAHALGIGSCWVHRAKEEFESPQGKALLQKWGIRGDYVGVGHCILGYPASEAPLQPSPRKADYILFDR